MQSYTYPEDRYILVGTVTKPQGLRGEICVHSLSGQPENFAEYSHLFLVDKHGELSPELKVMNFRFHKGRVILRLDRVTDRTHAERVSGMGVLVARDSLPKLDIGEFYWHQVIGRNVKKSNGEHLGILHSVFSNGAQDVMVITDGNAEYLVPLYPGLITGMDDENVVIDPPPGLLEINAEHSDD